MTAEWQTDHEGDYFARVGMFVLVARTVTGAAWYAGIEINGGLLRAGHYPTDGEAKTAAIALLRRICGDALRDVNKLEAGDA
jgi:hypothetical protein